MTHKQQQEWATTKKMLGALVGQVHTLTEDLKEGAERYNKLEARVKAIEAATVPEAMPV